MKYGCCHIIQEACLTVLPLVQLLTSDELRAYFSDSGMEDVCMVPHAPCSCEFVAQGEIDKLFMTIDRNQDDTIDLEEFREGYGHIAALQLSMQDHIRQIETIRCQSERLGASMDYLCSDAFWSEGCAAAKDLAQSATLPTVVSYYLQTEDFVVIFQKIEHC